MPLAALVAVLSKELRETLRDPNAFALSVLYPVFLYPAIVWGFSLWTEYQGGQQVGEQTAIVVTGPAAAQVEPVLGRVDGLDIVDMEAPEEALAAGRVVAVVQTDADAAGNVTVHTAFRSDSPRSERARKRVEEALDSWRKDRVVQAATAAGLDPAFAKVKVEMVDAEAKATMLPWALSMIVPVALALNAMVAGFYPTLEAAVGERERRTIETTLVCAAPRGAIVGGKLLAVVAIAAVATLVNLGAMLLSGWQLLTMLDLGGGFTLPIPATTWLGVIAAAVTAALVLEAWVMLAVIRARDFKQAQNIASFFLIVGTALAMFGAMEGYGPEVGRGLLPIANLVSVMREWLAGRPLWPWAPVAFLENLLVAVIPVLLGARVVAGEGWRSGATAEEAS